MNEHTITIKANTATLAAALNIAIKAWDEDALQCDAGGFGALGDQFRTQVKQAQAIVWQLEDMGPA